MKFFKNDSQILFKTVLLYQLSLFSGVKYRIKHRNNKMRQLQRDWLS